MSEKVMAGMKNDSLPSTMDLEAKIQPNDRGFFVITFFNRRGKNFLPEPTVKYLFSKFGPVADIKYTEHGRVFISYKEKEGALKALEVMNMGTKHHVETDWQTVKKNETVQSIKSEGDDSFIYLRLPPNVYGYVHGVYGYVSHKLFGGFKRSPKIKDKDFVSIPTKYII